AQYNEGNINAGGQLNPPEKTTFSLIDRIFEMTKNSLQLPMNQYNLYGHSAGAQFVHRFVAFYDSPYLKSAIAANAGWYTFPDENVTYPYGIKSIVNNLSTFKTNYFNKDLLILLGTADVVRDGALRVTPEADA